MLKLGFQTEKGHKLRLLCLGAHSDDIEVGCGGTILRLLEEYESVIVDWVVFGAEGERAREARESAERFLERAGQKRIVIKSFRDGFFPYGGTKIKEYFEALKSEVEPDLILTHYRHDLHQDHRLIWELTWNTFRDHFIMEYEVIKYDGDLGNPNLYVHLSEKTCGRKVENILTCFKSQLKRHWFTQDAFFSLLRVRGIESNAPENYAEAFYCRKGVM